MSREPADEVLLALARMIMDVSVRAADQLGLLSPVQLRALTVLRASGGVNLGTLAEAMGVTTSTASRLVDRLVTAEWVHRGVAPHTRREVLLGLTDEGRALLRRFDDKRLVELRSRLTQVPDARRGAVVQALGDLAAVSPPVR